MDNKDFFFYNLNKLVSVKRVIAANRETFHRLLLKADICLHGPLCWMCSLNWVMERSTDGASLSDTNG